MKFTPSHRLTSRLVPQPDQDTMGSSVRIPVFVAVKRRGKLRHYARCTFRGFFAAETMGRNNRPYMWMGDQAMVECHLPAAIQLQYIWLEVVGTSPSGSELNLYVNDKLVVNGMRVRGRSTIRAKLLEAPVCTEVSIQMNATTFVPKEHAPDSADGRQLGVAIGAIVFGKRKSKYRPGSYHENTIHRRLQYTVRGWLARKAA